MDAPTLARNLDLPDLLVGWAYATGVTVGESSPALIAELAELAADPARQGLNDEVRVGIRSLLRGHGYKPAGRGKPASEFLAGAAAQEQMPQINNLVDVNNLLSLETGWPISILDVDRAGTEVFELRHGHPDESYVFNNAGHEISLGGLLCVARPEGEAFGNPVKDSMATKLAPETNRVLGVIYSSRAVATPEQVAAASERFAELMRLHAGAQETAAGVV